jgi:hypothetical protein
MTQPLQIDWLADARFNASAATKPAKAMARRSDSVTSHQAADAATGFVASHEAKCFGVIHDAGERGATALEISHRAGLTTVQVCRRLGRMEERRLIERRLKDNPASATDYQQRGRFAVWFKR